MKDRSGDLWRSRSGNVALFMKHINDDETVDIYTCFVHHPDGTSIIANFDALELERSEAWTLILRL